MKLFLFRLSLKARRQADAFERRGPDGTAFTREQWLREVFSHHFTFTHRSNDFFFVPEMSETGIDPKLAVGWIARDRAVSERTAPWDGLSPTEHRSWQASLFAIDPTDHEDGQKVAFEQRSEIGQTAPIIASLARHLSNIGPEEPFTVTAYPLIQERSFSLFAAEHRGDITSITYDVAVPNMFSSPGDFTDEMRALRDKANVARVKTRLESDEVINTEASQLDEIATHVERGGGKISAKTKSGARYRSDEHTVWEDVPIEGDEPETPSYWARVRAALNRIF